MATNYIQDGRVLTVPATSGGTQNAIHRFDDTAGVVMETVAAATGATLEVAVDGVFRVAKDASAIAIGQKLHANASLQATTTATGPGLGIAAEAAATGATDVAVRLHTF